MGRFLHLVMMLAQQRPIIVTTNIYNNMLITFKLAIKPHHGLQGTMVLNSFFKVEDGKMAWGTKPTPSRFSYTVFL